MSPTIDVRREAVLSIERALVRQIEVMHLPVPKHYWTVSSDPQWGEAELICMGNDGETIATEFSGEDWTAST